MVVEPGIIGRGPRPGHDGLALANETGQGAFAGTFRACNFRSTLAGRTFADVSRRATVGLDDFADMVLVPRLVTALGLWKSLPQLFRGMSFHLEMFPLAAAHS